VLLGTELLRRRCNARPAGSSLGGGSGKVARFRQVNNDRPNVHHDALELMGGSCS
jgi:hypothetical protein